MRRAFISDTANCVTSDLKQVRKQNDELGAVRLVEHQSEQRAEDEVGDAEGGQGQAVEPLLPAKALHVVEHGGENDAVLDASRQEEARHGYIPRSLLPSLTIAVGANHGHHVPVQYTVSTFS